MTVFRTVVPASFWNHWTCQAFVGLIPHNLKSIHSFDMSASMPPPESDCVRPVKHVLHNDLI